MSKDEQAIRAAVADWIAATRLGDVQTILSLMTEDALFLVPGHEPMDRAAFEAASRAQSAHKMLIDAVSDIREVQVEGDMAFMWSQLKVTVTSPGATEPLQRAGHTLTVFRRRGGKWLLWRDANLLVQR